MDAVLVFGWLLSGQTVATWLAANDWVIDGDGLLPRNAEQCAQYGRMFPSGVWLTHGSAPDAPLQARCYAVTLFKPGCTRASVDDILNVPLGLVDVARSTASVLLGRLPDDTDPMLHTLSTAARSAIHEKKDEVKQIMAAVPKVVASRSDASSSARAIACERYSKFLLCSYLKWESSKDLRNASCLVRFHQPTLIDGKAFFPNQFIDLLKLQLLLDLELKYHSTSSGWSPNVEVSIVDDAALSLNIWFDKL